MIKVGITGQPGFMGTHLYNFLGLKKDMITRIPFRDEFFSNKDLMNAFVKECDTIVHIAGVNRHNEPEVIYNTNIQLALELIRAMEETGSKPHVIFSSSTQEERDNPYGKAKREARHLFEAWAGRNDCSFTAFIIPNVYGPFGNPYYNSVIATFSYQLTHNEQPKIEVDGLLKLIYIGELVELFYKEIVNNYELRITNYGSNAPKPEARNAKPETRSPEPEARSLKPEACSRLIPYTAEMKVTELLNILQSFKTLYFDQGIIPPLNSSFETNLFNTFRCYIETPLHFPVNLKLNTDDRGSFVETIKLAGIGGQVSFSTTKPGITRGNHYHIRKVERFAVIKGEALIQLRKIGTDGILNYRLSGDQPAYVDMPVWYTHNITNVSSEDLYTIFWINEFFNPDDPDTYFEIV